MKKITNLLKRGALPALALLLMPTFIFGGKPETKTPPAKTTCLLLSGTVKSMLAQPVNQILVKLVEENTVIDSVEVREGQAFAFGLQRDKQYAIKVFVPGLEPKLICISTKLPGTIKSGLISTFHFDLYAQALNESVAGKDDLADFPIALIAYDSAKRYFDYNNKYTSFIKKAYKGSQF